MRLDTLAGNTALKQHLSSQYAGRGFGHAYLITGPEGSGKRTLARLLAAAMVCLDGDPPCGNCLPCKKVLGGIHPDVIHVELLSGKREILVEQARQMRADAMIRPNEAERKVYIVHSAQTMNSAAQNAMLKILEEGPAYATFFLLADNPSAMLPTIRSRCENLALTPVSPEEAFPLLNRHFPEKSKQELYQTVSTYGGILGRVIDRLAGNNGAVREAGELISAFAAASELELMTFCGALERKKPARELLCTLLEDAGELLLDALALCSGAAVHVRPEELSVVRQAALLPKNVLLQALDAVRELRTDADKNVNTGNLCAALCARLGEALS